MTIFGSWVPPAQREAKERRVYILAFPSREAATASWKAFGADPVWKAAKDASETDGKLVKKVESVFLNPTAYSPIKGRGIVVLSQFGRARLLPTRGPLRLSRRG